jgi:hypothetical protein
MEVATSVPSGTGLKRDFGEVHFGDARLGDRRRRQRLVKVAQRLIEHPSGTLPKRMKDHAELTGLYRLMDCPRVTHASVLEPHRRRTLEQMSGHPLVLVLHDSTELDYTSRKSLKNLGQIGGGFGRGYVCHNSLAVTPDRGVIGLANQVLHVRRHVPANETPAQKRQHPQRESRLWLKGCEAIGTPPEGSGSRWIDIADRGGDTFEFAAWAVRNGREFVIRSSRDRNLLGEDHVGADRVYSKLYAYTRDLPDLGERVVRVPAAPGKHKAREARVRIAAGPVSLAGSRFVRGQTSGETSLNLWVIHLKERDATADASRGAGAEPLEWILLTNVPTESWVQACQRIDWYACRPMIEEYHKGQKTGASVQELQFESEQRLEPMIALLSVITAALLQLRQLAREPDAHRTPATSVVPAVYARVLSAERQGTPRDDLSVCEFCMMLAGLGGHLGRKRDGFPGWLTLWRGWSDLILMVKGVEALRGKDV